MPLAYHAFKRMAILLSEVVGFTSFWVLRSF